MRISSSEKTCPGGAAPAGVVELGEAQTVLRKPVKVGGFDLTSIASNIRPTHIIRHHDDDIGSALPIDKTRHEKKKAKGNWKFHKRVGASGFLLARRGRSQYLTMVLEHGAVAKW